MILSSLALLCSIACGQPAEARVTRILAEPDVTALTGAEYLVPHGLAVTSDGRVLFYDASEGAGLLEHDPASGSLRRLCTSEALAAIAPTTEGSLTCRDVEVDAADNAYAVLARDGDHFLARVPASGAEPEFALDVPDLPKAVYDLEIDRASGRLVVLIDAYAVGPDDLSGLYVTHLPEAEAPLEPLRRIATRSDFAAAATPALDPASDPVHSVGLAVAGGQAYLHLTAAPPGHGADGDLLAADLETGAVTLALDRERFREDLDPRWLRENSDFPTTAIAADGARLFLLTNVGLTTRLQEVYEYDMSAEEPRFVGRAASFHDLDEASLNLSHPIIVYGQEVDARDGAFYLLTGDNPTENLLRVAAWEPAPEPQRRIRVALYDGPGAGAPVIPGMKSHPDVEVVPMTPEEIAEGGLEGFDIVYLPGGSGSGQAKALGEAGRAEIQRFVREGGGYYGVCAGAYAAVCGYSWSMDLINAHAIDNANWARSTGPVEASLTPEGRRLLGDYDNPFTIHYGQGPILAPFGSPDLPEYTTLLTFESTRQRGASLPGVMDGSPAILIAPYGEGRVVCVSPHPEMTDGLRHFVYLLFQYLVD